MNRIALVSDATDEFPDNTTSSFKVCLPVPLELKGEGWKVGLASISTPDASLDLARVTNAVKDVVFETRCKVVGNVRDNNGVNVVTTVKMKEMRGDPSVVDGVSLMKALIRMSPKNEIKNGRTKDKRLYDCFRVTYEWEGDLPTVAKKTPYIDFVYSNLVSYVVWKVHINMALHMGWLVEAGKVKYWIGPNLRYESIYMTSGNGNYINPVNDTEIDNHDLWKEEGEQLRLSVTGNWVFTNFNVAFQEVLGEPSRTFLVYSDVVDNNIIGGERHVCSGARNGVSATRQWRDLL